MSTTTATTFLKRAPRAPSRRCPRGRVQQLTHPPRRSPPTPRRIDRPRAARLAPRAARRRSSSPRSPASCGPRSRSTTATPSPTRSARPASSSRCWSSARASCAAPRTRPRTTLPRVWPEDGLRPRRPGAEPMRYRARRVARIPAASCSAQGAPEPVLPGPAASRSPRRARPARVSRTRNVLPTRFPEPVDAPGREVVRVLAAVVELDLHLARPRSSGATRAASTRRR